MELHAVILCHFKQPRLRSSSELSMLLWLKNVRLWLWLLSGLTNSASENGNSCESNSYLFFDWAVNCAMECKLHADKALRFWILLLLGNIQGEDNTGRCLTFNLSLFLILFLKINMVITICMKGNNSYSSDKYFIYSVPFPKSVSWRWRWAMRLCSRH